MSKSRFFKAVGAYSLEDIAALTRSKLVNAKNPSLLITDIAPLDKAGEGQASFFDNQKYLSDFKKTKASVCFVAEKNLQDAPAGVALLVSAHPYHCYAIFAQKLYPRDVSSGKIHPSAIIDKNAKIGSNVEIRAGVVIEAGAEIGNGCILHPNVVIGENVIIGEQTIIGACASVYFAQIGRFCKIYPGARIGQDGFGFAIDPINGHKPIPQLGSVIIGDHCEIGSNACVDRGAGPDTVIGDGSFVDNLVQIGHNVRTGKNCVIVAQTGLSGSSKLEDMVVMAGQSATVGHITVGAGSQIAGQSAVMRDCPPGSKLAGSPAVPSRQFFKQLASMQKMAGRKSSRAS